MWLHDKQMKPFEKLWALYNSIQISCLAAGQAHFRGHVWRYMCIYVPTALSFKAEVFAQEGLFPKNLRRMKF